MSEPTPSFVPYDPRHKELSRELRKNQTFWEKKLWYQFLDKQYPQWYRQKPIRRFIVDFYCPKAKLVIELDGDSHYQEGAPSKDLRRDEELAELGMKVVRFTNTELKESFEAVCAQIEKAVKNQSQKV